MVRSLKFAALSSIFYIFFSCSSGQQDPPIGDQWEAEEKEQIRSLISSYYDDLSNRNWKAFDKHFWDKAIMATVWQRDTSSSPQLYAESSVDFIKQAHMGPASKPIFEEHMTSIKIMQQGNLAVVWADYDARFGDQTKIETWSGIDAFSLLRHEDQWKIVSLSYTSRD